MNYDHKELLKNLNSSTIADVLDGHGVWGVIDHRVQMINSAAKRFLGTAYTVRWAPVRKPSNIMLSQYSTWDAVKDFLVPEVKNAEGKVYVAGVDDGLCFDYALAGGMSVTDFSIRGFVGAVLGGGIRDAQVVGSINFPVCATNFTPADTQGNYRVVEVGGSCSIGRVTVQTGDLIFADETGTIAIPSRIVTEVIERTLSIENVEIEIISRLKSGEQLFDVVNSLGRI